MKTFFVAALLSLFATACGGPSSSSKPTENIIATNYSNEPIFLQRQNTSCSSKQFAGHISYSLYFHMEEIDTFEVLDLTHIFTQIFIKDRNVIARTIYGEKVERISSRLGDRVVNLASPKEVTICPDEEHYRQSSIESAAMNAAHVIHKTNQSFKQAVPEISVSPITLSISPAIIESTVTAEGIKESRYWTDNALYSPDSKYITFLPHSNEARSSGLNVNFWEIPMIASHEYGHHIFQAIFGGSKFSDLSVGCFGHINEKKDQIKNKNLYYRFVTNEDVLTAFNEGFADLISYYTLGATERGIRGIPCLEVTRDVGSARLVNGKSKILTDSVISTFFRWTSEESSCDQPSYQEVHVLGAVIAHSMDRFMGTLLMSEEMKIKNLVEWVKYLKTNRQRLKTLGPQTFFEEVMEAFINTTIQFNNSSTNSTICKNVRTSFPAIDYTECYGK